MSGATPWFLTKTFWSVAKFAPVGAAMYWFGKYLDRVNDLEMSDFHNKSKLFGGKDLAPGERVW